MKKKTKTMMNSTYFECNGQIYVYNINKLFELVSKSTADEPEDGQITIQASYAEGSDEADGQTLMSKDVVETKNNVNKELMSIKYNFLKCCIDDFFDAGYNESGAPKEFDLENLSLRQMVAFNTLLQEGIIYILNK